MGKSCGAVRPGAHRLSYPLSVGCRGSRGGGVIAYGTDIVDGLRRAADILARVLKGEKPGDLAVDQAARFQLVLNQTTAREIGITVPPSVLIRADRVIE